MIAPVPRQISGRAPQGTPLYVHVPFCAAKCHYCDFFSVAAEGEDLEGAIDALLAEAAARAGPLPPTVFVGGGTPSLLDETQLTRLFEGLQSLIDFRSSALEVTVECNPESLDRRKAEHLLALGATRLSVGVQALDDGVLERFGRVHSAADALRGVEAARASGARVSTDLIYAYPGQTTDKWASDLSTLLDFELSHLSAYNLTYEEGTRFHRWLGEGKLAQLPDELELELFWMARRAATERGLDAYEVSNYASSGYECAHNIGYWRNGPYVGIGPGAVSHVGGVRAGNPRSIPPWRSGVDKGGVALAWSEGLGALEKLGETWWLGLRLAQGITPAEARAASGFEPDPARGPQADPALAIATRLVESGHLELRGERYRLTESGLPVADAVAAEFLRLTPGNLPA